jgi:malonyl CoA-acyl carrier protein transacylase
MSDKLFGLADFHKRYVKPAQQELAIDMLKAQLAEARELLLGWSVYAGSNELRAQTRAFLAATEVPPQSGQSLD